MINKFLILICVGIFLLNAGCGGGGGGGSSSSVNQPSDETAATFTEVNQIISNNCLSCHGATTANGAPMSLTTFSEISFFASSISNRINKSENDSQLMPQAGNKLSASDIAKIDSWIAAGKLNN